MAKQHFLTLLDIDPADLSAIINRAAELKSLHKAGKPHDILKGRVLGMIFEKSSTRTRVAFEAGMAQLGGSAIFLSPTDTQLGRGEPVEDTARVLSEMVDVVMIRAGDHAMVERFAEYSSVPVINALTDRYHPCQLLADMQTYRDNRGDIAGRTVTWIGDGFNMCNSFINASRQFGFHLRVACPEGYDPDPELMHANANTVTLVRDPREAAADSDLVVTDVWSSMGHEEEQAQRKAAFADYQVAPSLMDLARPDALFMHCLPAHRGEEVSEDMLDDPRSVVFEEAGNRLHTQKALLEYLVG